MTLGKNALVGKVDELLWIIELVCGILIKMSGVW